MPWLSAQRYLWRIAEISPLCITLRCIECSINILFVSEHHFPQCQSLQCHSAQCHSAQCHFTQCHSVQCWIANCSILHTVLVSITLPNISLLRSVKCHLAKCRFTEWRSDENHLFNLFQIKAPRHFSNGHLNECSCHWRYPQTWLQVLLCHPGGLSATNVCHDLVCKAKGLNQCSDQK